MHKTPNIEKIAPPTEATATRWNTSHDWCYRGDNTKYKEKK